MWGKFVKLLLLGCGVVLFCSTIRAQTVRQYQQALDKGEKAIENGEIERALNLWESVSEGPPEQLSDPRIGISYIETVTREHLLERYSKASELYLWGLSNPAHPVFEEELAREIKRLEPIADRDEYKKWRQLEKDGRLQTLGKSISGFWKSRDPTMNSPHNERLVEHWKRIAYSKENFQRASNTVYETDDRALAYIKFGEPDRKRDGIINLNVGQLRNWIVDGSDITSFPDLSLVDSEDSLSMARNQAKKRVEVEKMLRNVKRLHRYPYYEVWVYRGIDFGVHRDKLIYIFGDDGNTGEFTMMNSLEDMMPNSAFRSSSLEPNAVPPSYFLQLLYYGEMISVDSYFADAFRELEGQLFTTRGPTRYSSYNFRDQNRSKLAMNRITAPDEKSTYASDMLNIPVDVKQYRLLDENNDPYLATFVYSRPHKSFYIDQIRRNLFDEWAYSVNTSFISTTENNRVLFERKNSQGMKSDTGLVERMRPLVDYFEIPQDSNSSKQVVSVELLNSRMDSTTAREVLFPENVRALGKTNVEQPGPPLSTDNSSLEMGDLIIGYKDSSSFVNNEYGFAVGHDRTIPDGKNLMVHIEIYHLNANSAAPVIPFKIDYSVKPDKNFLQRLFTKSEETRLTLNFETGSTMFRDNLEVDTSPFDPGIHTLTLKVTDLSTEQVVEREVKFKIRKAEDVDDSAS